MIVAPVSFSLLPNQSLRQIIQPMQKTLQSHPDAPLSSDLLNKIDAYWRAANYLSVGQIYLYDNPLLREPLKPEHIKHMLLGHWGTTPGQNFIYVHLNRLITKHNLNMIYIAGPGHGGPAIVGQDLSRRNLHRDLSQHHPERSRA